jgi:ATP-dependent RNA helicase DeaD
MDSLRYIGFKTPTKIQSETIPLIKQGYDIIGQSKTGSGKTGAFGIPIVEKVVKGNNAQALILAPTRELAKQIASDISSYSMKKGLQVQTVYGGVSMGPQINGLKNSEIIVATPGRMLDHIRRGNFYADNIKFFVLDEADTMIDMGFINDIEDIANYIPHKRQNLLFSATMPRELVKVTERLTVNAKKVTTELKVEEDLLKQYYYEVEHKEKFSLLVSILSEEKPDSALIFCKTRINTEKLCKNLRNNGIKAEALHGGLSQNKREQILDKFYKGSLRYLVATNVASRGIDVDHITHIYNFNIPATVADYVNRIGRTARAGNSGIAISLVTENDSRQFKEIRRQYSFNIQKIEKSDYDILPFQGGKLTREKSSRRYPPNNKPILNKSLTTEPHYKSNKKRIKKPKRIFIR